MTKSTQGGDSSVATITDGFGFGDGKTSNVQPSSIPPEKAENSHSKTEDGQILAKETAPELEESEEQKEEKQKPESFEKQADDARARTIDLLEEKLQDNKDGKMSDLELIQWFDKHPEFGTIANSAKRIKEDYRALKTRVKTPESQFKKEEKRDDKKDPFDRPLTLRDLEERDHRLLEQQLIRERKNQIKEFAIKHKIVDEKFEQLQRNAEALQKANPEWGYSEAITASYNTIKTLKGSPVNIATPNTKAPEMVSTKIDASVGGIQLITASEFSGGQLK